MKYAIICRADYNNRPTIKTKVGEFSTIREARAYLSERCYNTPTVHIRLKNYNNNNQNNKIMKTEDVRFVTVSPDTGKVFVALKNGKNVIRHFSGDDVRAANKTIREGGHAARVEFVVNLINTKYKKFEWPKPVPMCAADESFWLLHTKRQDCGLSPEEEKEYQYLLNKWNVF